MALEDLLAGWTGPSSATEKEKQERTERMVREAVQAHNAFNGYVFRVYAKGSYPNNTNVRADSDVDIAVHCCEVIYWKVEQPGAHQSGTPYQGPWTPVKLRTEVEAALRSKFPGQVDASGNTALTVRSSTARVDADVVPCFSYRYYFADGGHRDGTRVFRKSGDWTENYPEQHLAQGRAKNTATSTRFKQAVRVMKRVENAMVKDGTHRKVPSFFVECLVYNCPNHLFGAYSWTERIRNLIIHISAETQGDVEPSEPARWREVNECKYLFGSDQEWSRKDARDFAKAAWNYLGYT